MIRKPKYFFVAFGRTHSNRHPVEGGCYPHSRGYVSSQQVAPGDVMLLHCVRGYPEFDQEAPGIGVVIKIEPREGQEVIFYQYLPLNKPVDWNTLKVSIKELRDCTNFSLKGNWLRRIHKDSFKKAILGHEIGWP